jgi:hypothetical protein
VDVVASTVGRTQRREGAKSDVFSADFRRNPSKNTAEDDVPENAASGYDEVEGAFTVDEPGSGGAPRSNSNARRCSGLVSVICIKT